MKLSLPAKLENWITAAVFNSKWMLPCFFTVLVVVSILGMSLLTFSNDYHIFFSDRNPELIDFVAFENEFGKTDSIFIVLHSPDSGLLQQQLLADIEVLVSDLGQLEFVTDVQAITGFQYVESDGQDLLIEPYFSDVLFESPESIEQRARQLLNDKMIQGGYITKDGKTSLINIVMDLPENNAFAVMNAAEEVGRIASEFADFHPGLEVASSGVIMLNAAFGEAGINDALILLPVMFLVLLVVLNLFLRSIIASCLVLLVVSLSSLSAFAMAAYLSIPITVVSISSLIIIMTLAVANCIHIINAVFSASNSPELSLKEAIKSSFSKNLLPVSLTCITTMIGFLTLNFSDSPPYWHLGNITAMGVAFAWMYSLFLLPRLLQHVHFSKKAIKHNNKSMVLSAGFANWVVEHYKVVFFVAVIICTAVLSQLPKLHFNDQFVEYFSMDIKFRQDTEFMQEHISGLYTIEYAVPAAGSNGIFKEDYYQNLHAFSQWYQQQPEVNYVYSFSGLLEKLHLALGNNANGIDLLPQDEQMAAQEYLLYEMAMPFDATMEDRISLDKSVTRLSILVNNLSSVEMQSLLERANNWQQKNWPAYMHSKPTGPAVMFAYISKRNIESMFWGNLLALLLISLLLYLLLGSFLTGTVSIITNTMPVLMMFGLWAAFSGEVGMVGTTIAAATLGIVVDDTIHFMTRYQKACNELGMGAREALQWTFEEVGVAIFTTSIVLVFGLSVLMLSDFLLNYQAGILSVMTIILALLFDGLVLPAILLLLAKTRIKAAQKPAQQALMVNK